MLDLVGQLGIEPVVAFYVARRLSKVKPEEIGAVLKSQLPPRVNDFQLSGLYTTFWEGGLSDLIVPEAEYFAEAQRIKIRIEALTKSQPVRGIIYIYICAQRRNKSWINLWEVKKICSPKQRLRKPS